MKAAIEAVDRDMLKVVSFKIDEELSSEIDSVCRARGIPRSVFIREALETHLARYLGLQPEPKSAEPRVRRIKITLDG